MKSIRKRYYQTLLILMAIMCAISIGLSFWAIHNAESVYMTETYRQIHDVKKIFLKDTVQNTLRDIDATRARLRTEANERLEEIADLLDEESRSASGQLETYARHLLEDHEHKDRFIYRIATDRGETLLSSSAPDITRDDAQLVRHLDYGQLTVDLGINARAIDELAKSAIHTSLHGKVFQEDSYLWVNEILDFNGGKHYAVRRIHPNLKNTEGMTLSTELRDIKGNTPYLTELEGIKKDGEIYFTYWFKRKNGEEIVEKLTYAALYKDFNWVVAIGIPLEDIQVHADRARESSQVLSSRVITIALAAILALFLSGLLVLFMMQKQYMRRTEFVLREESNRDPLTGLYNRRIGDVYLKEAFRKFSEGSGNPALFFFDIDNFKRINDTWGHEAGDTVLKTVVEQFSQIIRAEDLAFRWGGEEFIIIADGVSVDNAKAMAGKLNATIAQQPVQINDERGIHQIAVTVSIGIAWFDSADQSPDEALKRADAAQYLVKKSGKNGYRIG